MYKSHLDCSVKAGYGRGWISPLLIKDNASNPPLQEEKARLCGFTHEGSHVGMDSLSSHTQDIVGPSHVTSLQVEGTIESVRFTILHMILIGDKDMRKKHHYNNYCCNTEMAAKLKIFIDQIGVHLTLAQAMTFHS